MTRQTGQLSREDSNTESVSNIRRKLIKVSVATVPLVMTLQSGAAIAAASAYQCIGGKGEAPATFLKIPKNADGTVNVTARIGDKWSRAMAKNPNTDDTEMGLIFFDANGNRMGKAGDPSAGGAPATQSCAVSFIWN